MPRRVLLLRFSSRRSASSALISDSPNSILQSINIDINYTGLSCFDQSEDEDWVAFFDEVVSKRFFDHFRVECEKHELDLLSLHADDVAVHFGVVVFG